MNLRVRENMRQLIDWSAALWASLISGLIFFLLNILLSYIAVGSPWIYVRVIASIIMGPEVLPPPASFDFPIFMVGTLLHFFFSFIFAILIDVSIYRWGIVIGIIGGGLLGLAFYTINFYAVSYYFPWIFPFRSWMILTSHIVFGALAGGIYELLEVEEFVPADN